MASLPPPPLPSVSPPVLPYVVALADDLSGAAETACALGGPVRLSLNAADVAETAAAHDLVVDLDTRRQPSAEAAYAVRTALRAAQAGPPRLLYKKVDSQLRGNLAAEAAAYAEGATAVVIAPALPAARRTVTGGVVHVNGVPLHRTDGWRAERASAPRSLAEALSGLPVRTVPLDVVRSEPVALDAEFRRIAASGAHPAPDAETDADLDAVAAAALRLGPGFRLLGSGGLAAALGRTLLRPAAVAPRPRPPGTAPRCSSSWGPPSPARLRRSRTSPRSARIMCRWIRPTWRRARSACRVPPPLLP